MRLIPWFVLLLLIGCGIVSGPSPADPTCASLDMQHVVFETTAIVGGAISGAASAALPVVGEYADPDDLADWNLGLGLTSIVGAGLTVLGVSMSGIVGQRWNELGCGGAE